MVAQENFMDWDKPGIAVVTEASSGIGASFARILASQGFQTLLIARRKEKLKAVAKEIREIIIIIF